MNNHDYKQTAYYLIYLIRCVLNDKVPSQEKLDKMNLSQLFEVAQRHTLTAICAYALESAGIFDKAFTEAKNKAIRKNIILDAERENVFAEFEKAGIWYMPLKGSILKDYYPKIGMRQMCDNDILIDRSRVEDIKSIMNGLGFDMEHDDSGHDLAFFKKPVCNFELHTELFGSGAGAEMNPYYNSIFSRILKDKNKQFGYHFSNEDFYIFMIAHEYKHFYYGGTGLRSLVDRYVFLSKFSDRLDMVYIEDELSKMGITEYEMDARSLSLKLFNGVTLSDNEKELLDYYIFSNTYGITENIVKNRLRKNGRGIIAKLKYLTERIFTPISRSNPNYRLYASAYPLFYNNKFLMPLLPFYRLGRGLKKSRKRIMTEIKTLINP